MKVLFYQFMDEFSDMDGIANLRVEQKNAFLSKLFERIYERYEMIRNNFEVDIPTMNLYVCKGFSEDIGKRTVRVNPGLYRLLSELGGSGMVQLRYGDKEVLCIAKPGMNYEYEIDDGFVMMTEDLRKELGVKKGKYLMLEPVMVVDDMEPEDDDDDQSSK